MSFGTYLILKCNQTFELENVMKQIKTNGGNATPNSDFRIKITH